MSEVISILETQHIKREKSGQGDNISLRCWEYNEKKSCDKKCANCLIFNRKVDHCFILVKQFGRERILCEGNCMDCGYFLDFFKEKGGETDARSGRSGKGKSYGKKNFFLQKISYTTGHNLNRLVSKMAKVYNSFKKGN